MKHTIAFRVHLCKAVGAHKFLALLAEYRGPHARALVAERRDANFRCSMLSSVAIEMTFPKALHAVIIQTVIACESCWIIFALFTSLLRLDNLSVRDLHEHGLVLQPSSTSMHIFEALETKIIFAVGTENLRFLANARGAKTTNCSLQFGMVGSQSNGVLRSPFVQRIETGLTERHQTLVAFQLRLHH
jgi:hypothetical protein